jgi:hypothetical protein
MKGRQKDCVLERLSTLKEGLQSRFFESLLDSRQLRSDPASGVYFRFARYPGIIFSGLSSRNGILH